MFSLENFLFLKDVLPGSSGNKVLYTLSLIPFLHVLCKMTGVQLCGKPGQETLYTVFFVVVFKVALCVGSSCK